MTAFRHDPYLWLHLAGLAALPLWLDLCLAGLAVGNPVVPPWLEQGLLVLIGTVPVLWMQWHRPFYLFSALVVAVRPQYLSEEQRRLLQLQRGWLGRIVAIAIAAVSVWLLSVLYALAPVAATTTPLAGSSRVAGWLVGAIAFLLANLFLQVSGSALRLLLARPSAVAAATPYPLEAIPHDFTLVGLRVAKLLPERVVTQPSPEAITPHPTAEISHSDATPAEVAPETTVTTDSEDMPAGESHQEPPAGTPFAEDAAPEATPEMVQSLHELTDVLEPTEAATVPRGPISESAEAEPPEPSDQSQSSPPLSS